MSNRWRELLADDVTWMNLCAKHDYGRRMSENHLSPPTIAANLHRPPPNPVHLGAYSNDNQPSNTNSSVTAMAPFMQGNSRSFDSAMSGNTTRRPAFRSYKSHFKQKYLVETAWRTGGKNIARHITQDQGVVTSLHLTPKYIVVALDNAKIHVFNTEGNAQKTLLGHVMGVWAMVPWDDVLVSGGCDRDVRVWNMSTG